MLTLINDLESTSELFGVNPKIIGNFNFWTHDGGRWKVSRIHPLWNMNVANPASDQSEHNASMAKNKGNIFVYHTNSSLQIRSWSTLFKSMAFFFLYFGCKALGIETLPSSPLFSPECYLVQRKHSSDPLPPPLHLWLSLGFFSLIPSLQLIWPVVVAGLREWIDPRLVNKAIIRSRLSLCLCTDSTLDGANGGGGGEEQGREGRWWPDSIFWCASAESVSANLSDGKHSYCFSFNTVVEAEVSYFEVHTCPYIITFHSHPFVFDFQPSSYVSRGAATSNQNKTWSCNDQFLWHILFFFCPPRPSVAS